jgi:hypothetical protein
VTNENPYYKQQVATAIYGFVHRLKGEKALKITGILIDVSIHEIQSFLKSYDLYCMKVTQADALLALQMPKGQK